MPIKLKDITFYTPGEVAKIMSLHPITVRNMMRLGQLPAHKFGGRWYISEDKLAAVISGEIDTNPKTAGDK